LPVPQPVHCLYKPSSASKNSVPWWYGVGAGALRTSHWVHPSTASPHEHAPTASASVGVAVTMYAPWSHVSRGLHPGPTFQVARVHLVQTPALVLSTMLLLHLPSADGGEHFTPVFAALLHTPPSCTQARPFFLSPTATKPAASHTPGD